MARKIGHAQVKIHHFAGRKPFEFSEKHDLIAVAAPSKTLVVPETVSACMHRK
jgi:hypothetical protein